MRNGYRVIDADRHVLEPIDLWGTYLPAEFRDRAPYYEYFDRGEPLESRIADGGSGRPIPLPPDLMVDGAPVVDRLSRRARIELAGAAYEHRDQLLEAQTPDGHLRDMDQRGIDVSMLYPTLAMYLVSIETMAPALAMAYATAYNAWLRDFCAADPQRLRAVGLICRHDPGGMIEELERIHTYGWRTIVLRPNPVRGRLLSDPSYESFWQRCEQLDVAVAIHEGAQARVQTVGADRFTTRFAMHACSHPMEQMMALLALIEGGVLERHPRLRVAFLEAGCGWLPYWLWRLDDIEYGTLAGEVADRVTMKPSAYFRRQCMVGIEPDEPGLAAAIRHIGADRVLFGSDYPHLDHDDDLVGALVGLTERGVLSDDELHAVLWDNPARFHQV